jgi:hypothetical protein
VSNLAANSFARVEGCSLTASISTRPISPRHRPPTRTPPACPLFDAKLMDGVRIGELPL